jgi:hypothetical protein
MATNNSSNLGTMTAHGIFIAEGTSAPVFTTLTNGQMLIGSTGADPVAATITGSGITVTAGAGTLSLTATGGGMAWVDTTGTSASMAVNTGYVADNAGLVTFTLPAAAVIGDTVEVVGKGAGGWSIIENASQIIHFGNQTTTVTTGHLDSSNQWDCIRLTCVTTNTTWVARAAQGNITVV